eukprot:m.132830 g.132830  ORF g.132830 m.132830 type:complete len:416 (+) comp9840_c0_seq2:14-1261(+)
MALEGSKPAIYRRLHLLVVLRSCLALIAVVLTIVGLSTPAWSTVSTRFSNGLIEASMALKNADGQVFAPDKPPVMYPEEVTFEGGTTLPGEGDLKDIDSLSIHIEDRMFLTGPANIIDALEMAIRRSSIKIKISTVDSHTVYTIADLHPTVESHGYSISAGLFELCIALSEEEMSYINFHIHTRTCMDMRDLCSEFKTQEKKLHAMIVEGSAVAQLEAEPMLKSLEAARDACSKWNSSFGTSIVILLLCIATVVCVLPSLVQSASRDVRWDYVEGAFHALIVILLITAVALYPSLEGFKDGVYIYFQSVYVAFEDPKFYYERHLGYSRSLLISTIFLHLIAGALLFVIRRSFSVVKPSVKYQRLDAAPIMADADMEWDGNDFASMLNDSDTDPTLQLSNSLTDMDDDDDDDFLFE